MLPDYKDSPWCSRVASVLTARRLTALNLQFERHIVALPGGFFRRQPEVISPLMVRPLSDVPENPAYSDGQYETGLSEPLSWMHIPRHNIPFIPLRLGNFLPTRSIFLLILHSSCLLNTSKSLMFGYGSRINDQQDNWLSQILSHTIWSGAFGSAACRDIEHSLAMMIISGKSRVPAINPHQSYPFYVRIFTPFI